ncbi:hypothetical protein CIK05_02575 [Bdellovibrio sp. qaytius]|nr:hypothetical protein CIK05_02575 [Bdellovibrio sp. qaytius]
MIAQSQALESSLKDAIKSVLKLQKKSYEDLAEELEISVPTVKRILTKEEIGLSRLLHICDYLKVSLTELEKIANHNKNATKNTFTEKQEEFLAKNTNYLTFLLMMYSGQTLEEIQSKTKIDDKSMKLYLLRLEKLDLITYHKGKYTMPFEVFPNLIPYGKIHEANFNNIITSGADFFKRYNRQRILAKNLDRDKGSTMGLTMLTLSRESYLEWFEKIRKLYLEIQDTAVVEEKMPKLKNKKTVVIMSCHGVLETNDPEVDFLQNSFGVVKNIT